VKIIQKFVKDVFYVKENLKNINLKKNVSFVRKTILKPKIINVYIVDGKNMEVQAA